MDKIVIKGGERLRGEVRVSGAKNAALPILCSSLLATGRSVYRNVPGLGDVRTMKKLLAGRVRAVVIDKAVLRYLLASDPVLSKERDSLAFDSRPLAELTLHVCFQRTPLGLKLKESYDAALLKTDIPKIENAYFEQLDRTLAAQRRPAP